MASPALLRAILLAVVAACSVAVYFNSMSNGFVYDDMDQVVANPWIRDGRFLPDIFTTNAWGYKGQESNYYRPGMHLVFSIAYRFFGLNPNGFHLVNVLFHSLNSILVFFLLSLLLEDRASGGGSSSPWAPFLGGLLFSTHPIHTEAVTWVSGIPDLSFTLFGLLSCLFHFRHAGSGSMWERIFPILSGLMFFAALLCKETALVIPLILAAHDLVLWRSGSGLFAFARRYFPHVVLGVLYFGLREYALQGLVPVKRYADLTLYQIVTGAITLLSEYLAKLVLPVDLNAFHVFHSPAGLWNPRGIASVLIIFCLIGLLFLFFRKRMRAFLFTVIVLAPLFPVLYVPALGENPFAERYLYFPSIGFVSMLALGFDRLRLLRSGGRTYAAVVFGLLVLAYSYGTIDRNRVWKDEHTLWEDTVRKSPDGAIPNYNFALTLHRRGDIDGAIEYYRKALLLKPSARVYTDLGAAYFATGRIDEAIGFYREAIRIGPRYSPAYNNLGVALGAKGLVEESVEPYLVGIRLNPSDPDLYNNLGSSYLRLGRKHEAIDCFQTALRLDPNHANARDNLLLATRQ